MNKYYEEYEMILSNYGYVHNLENAVDGLEYRIKSIPSPEVTRTYLASVNNACSYVDSMMNPVADPNEAMYMLVGTGYTDIYTGEPVVFSFKKKPTDWCGAFVGTPTTLKNKLSKGTVKDKKAFETEEKYSLDKSIIENALESEPWGERLTNGRLMITSYRIGLEGKIINNIMMGVKQGYVESMDKTKILYNLGIVDKLSDYIYVVASVERYIDREDEDAVNKCRTTKIRLVNGHIVHGQAELIKEGFDYQDIRNFPDPVLFLTNPSEAMFSSNIDVHCTHAFTHAVYERSERLPEGIEISEKKLAECIRNSIELSLKMQKVDYNFIKPMYSPRFDQICYLLPLYITGTLGEKPDLAIVVTDGKHFATFRTIIGLAEAYANARVLGYSENSWLKREWCFCGNKATEKGGSLC